MVDETNNQRLGGALSKITQRQKQKYQLIIQKLEWEFNQLSSTIDNMVDGMIATDGAGRILFHNQAALKLLGRIDPVKGKLVSQVLILNGPDDKPFNVFENSPSTFISRNDLSLISSRDQKIYVQLDISPFKNAAGGQHGYIIVLRNINKERRLDEERNSFFETTLRDLKMPVIALETSIGLIGAAKTYQSLPPRTKDLVEQAQTSASLIANLVKNLELLNDIERGRIGLILSSLELKPWIRALTNKYKKVAENKNLNFELICDDDIGSVKTSELYLDEIISNFISNAIEYTDIGKVEVKLSHQNSSIIFSVKDTGKGIAAVDKGKIFRKYYRGQDYLTQRTHGSGLGLYIALKLALILNGKVWFTSSQAGSTFFLEIPADH